MTNVDYVCLEAIEARVLRVDAESGLVYATRFRPSEPRGTKNPMGYLVCTVHWGGLRVQAKIHRIVWLSAHGDIPDGLVIDHINRNKADNRIVNLRLADSVLNSHNRRRYLGSENPSAKINAEIAESIRNLRSERSMSYPEIAATFGVSKSLVAQIIRKELW